MLTLSAVRKGTDSGTRIELMLGGEDLPPQVRRIFYELQGEQATDISVLDGFVGGLIQASAGGLHGGRALARTGRGGVILLAVFMALQELGIATDIVTTAFAILFGAIALAMALAFGLGNRELAAEVTREWYERWRREREELLERERAAEAASDAEIEEEEREIARTAEREIARRAATATARRSGAQPDPESHA